MLVWQLSLKRTDLGTNIPLKKKSPSDRSASDTWDPALPPFLGSLAGFPHVLLIWEQVLTSSDHVLMPSPVCVFKAIRVSFFFFLSPLFLFQHICKGWFGHWVLYSHPRCSPSRVPTSLQGMLFRQGSCLGAAVEPQLSSPIHLGASKGVPATWSGWLMLPFRMTNSSWLGWLTFHSLGWLMFYGQYGKLFILGWLTVYGQDG